MWNNNMKKYILIIAIVFLSFSQLAGEAFPPPQPTQVNYVMPVHTGAANSGVNYGVGVNSHPGGVNNHPGGPSNHHSGHPGHPQAYNQIIIQSGNNVYTTTSPRYPSQSYVYKDFGGQQKYPNRNYYIPSYCMHDNYIYYGNGYNPFCSQYRRYGNGMYINF